MARPDAEKTGDRLVARNRRAFFDFNVGESIEAGLVLIGSEVRSLRESGADLRDAWIDVDARGEAWVRGMRIPHLKHAAFGHEEQRPRKLLLHAQQIARLKSAVERDGMTIVALKCYFKNNRAKLEVAVARGKKKYDKRRALRDRDAEREARAAMQRARR